MDRETLQHFNRLNDKLNKIMEKQRQEHWVKVGFITQVTGWSAETLRQARQQGLVQWKDNVDGRFYLLESIPEIFIRHENIFPHPALRQPVGSIPAGDRGVKS
jgi:hypothetical protein